MIPYAGGLTAFGFFYVCHRAFAIQELIATEDVNFAIRINFPGIYAEGFRIGFFNAAPQRQEEISQENRLQNQVNE
ncbi:unnamed protein product [marine sediment metagenome]|uniref:Uncharacterized protein n=1 Tax=marine sediment metagenome TaxID=412755 RepID=X1TYX3_9ZZZZ